MQDRVSEVSWNSFRESTQSVLGFDLSRLNEYGKSVDGKLLGLAGQIHVSKPILNKLASVRAYRLDYNPNHLFGGRPYTVQDILSVTDYWWDRSQPIDIEAIKEEVEASGYSHVADMFRVRITRVDLNADLQEPFTRIENRLRPRQHRPEWHINFEKGRLSAVIGNDRFSLVIYEKDRGYTRIELQVRPTEIFFVDDLQMFFNPGFSFTQYCGNPFIPVVHMTDESAMSRMVDLALEHDASPTEVYARLTPYLRKKMIYEADDDFSKRVDTAYWTSFSDP